MHQPILITNVCLVDGINAPKTADVLMEGGRFAAFGRPGELQASGAEIISGQGKYLIPGLWEAHTHLMMGIDGSQTEKVEGVKKALQTYLFRGITSVTDLGCPEDIMNIVRSDIASKRSVYPEFYFAGPVFTGVNGWPLCMTCDHSSSLEIRPESPVESMVARLVGKTDFIKIIYDGLPGGSDKFPRSSLERVIRSAHTHGKKAIVHVRSKDDVIDAVQAGADSIEHIFQPNHPDRVDEAVEAAELMAKYKVFWCPTLATYEQIAHLGSISYLERLREDGIISLSEMLMTKFNPMYNRAFPRISAQDAETRLSYSMSTMHIFAKAGVNIVAGSDIALAMSRPGAILRELQLFSQAGLDNATIIRSATVNAAMRLGLRNDTSGFFLGSMANALLVDKDPLQSIDALVRREHVEKVFKSGVFAG